VALNTINLSMTIWVMVMGFNATFSNIKVIVWRSVLLVEGNEVSGEID
jgi:hypothetical protein